MYTSKSANYNDVAYYCSISIVWGRRARDRMVVGLTTTCAISAYHH